MAGKPAIEQIEILGAGMGGEGGYQRTIYVINSRTGKLFTLQFLVLTDKDLLNSGVIDNIIKNFSF